MRSISSRRGRGHGEPNLVETDFSEGEAGHLQNSGLTFGDLVWVVIAFLTLAGTGWAIWWKIVAVVNEAKAAAYHKSDEAKVKAEAAAAMASLAREELASYKTHAAETFATKQGVAEATSNLTKAVHDIGDRIDKRLDTMTDRLDRVIEHNHKPVRRQSG
jgi:hypothetical protein